MDHLDGPSAVRLPGVSVSQVRQLWFGPNDPVRAASAVARLGGGWLIAQDDAAHGGWWRPPREHLDRIRLLAPRDGLDVFSEASGTKHLKPDLESACRVPLDGGSGVLLLGSGSLPNRTHGALAQVRNGQVRVRSRDLGPLYEQVAAVLDLNQDQINLEGACVVGDRLRWFQRGHAPSGVPSASVDLDVADVVAVLTTGSELVSIDIGRARHYDLGSFDGLPLAITDAVVLPDGTVCVSATAEDTLDPVADGPIAGSVLALLIDDVSHLVPLPPEAAGHKVEGLAVSGARDGGVELLAVVDHDDPHAASIALILQVCWDSSPRSSP